MPMPPDELRWPEAGEYGDLYYNDDAHEKVFRGEIRKSNMEIGLTLAFADGGAVDVPASRCVKFIRIARSGAEVIAKKPSALSVQISGDHYKKLKIQPFEYIHANGIPFAEGSVIKYVTRWRDKGGIKDLEKARHFLDLLIEAEGSKNG